MLGASGWQTFWRVTLPNVKWGVLYGVMLCNARAMGEFGAVSVVSGHIRGETNTMPLHAEILLQRVQRIVGAFAWRRCWRCSAWPRSSPSRSSAGPANATDQTISSRSSGVRKRGVTRMPPSHWPSSPAASSTMSRSCLPTSSSSRTAISPDGRCAQPPTIRPPARHSVRCCPSGRTAAARAVPGTSRRVFQPIGVGSSDGSSATHGSGAATGSTSSASATPGSPSRSTSTEPNDPSARWTSRAVRPVHQRHQPP